MIYGYEQAQLFPVLSVYDTGVMNMYINTLKNEYERGLQEQKEFNAKFGDFTTPFEKDAQSWDNMTMKPINDLYNQLVAQGIDPVRSQAGRAAMEKAMRSVDYTKLAKLRQSAEAGKKYISSMSDLAKKGLYSRDLERALGIPDINGYDTLSSGMWLQESPTQMKSLFDLTNDLFAPLAKQNFDLGQGRDKYHRKRGVTVEHMEPITEQALDRVKNSPYYQYYLDTYGSDEGIKQAMINVNKGVLHDEEIDDTFAIKQWENNQKWARARYEAQQAASLSGQKDEQLLIYKPLSSLFQGGIQTHGFADENTRAAAIDNYIAQAMPQTFEKLSRLYKQGKIKEFNDYRDKVMRSPEYNKYMNRYLRGVQGETMSKALASGSIPYQTAGALIFAHAGSDDLLNNMIPATERGDNFGTIKLDKSNIRKVKTIQGVTWNTGNVRKSLFKNIKRYWGEKDLNQLENGEVRIAGGEGGVITIYQEDGRYHHYAKVYSGEKTGWYDLGPVDLTSERAGQINNTVIKEGGVSTTKTPHAYDPTERAIQQLLE